jgi:hypothetical protein
MARDISILPPNKQPAYEQIKASLGEDEADKFFDNYFKDQGFLFHRQSHKYQQFLNSLTLPVCRLHLLLSLLFSLLFSLL